MIATTTAGKNFCSPPATSLVPKRSVVEEAKTRDRNILPKKGL